jgi:hypothetical protein
MEEHLKKRYTAFPIAEVVQAPLDALQGIEEDTAKEFRRLFQIETIEDLANFSYCLWAAQVIQWNDWGLTDLPDNVKENLDSPFRSQAPAELLQQKVTAFSNIGDSEAQFLSRFYVETIEDLAYMLYFNWAQQIVEKKLLAAIPEESTSRPKAASAPKGPNIRNNNQGKVPSKGSRLWALFFLLLAGLLAWQFGGMWHSLSPQGGGKAGKNHNTDYGQSTSPKQQKKGPGDSPENSSSEKLAQNSSSPKDSSQESSEVDKSSPEGSSSKGSIQGDSTNKALSKDPSTKDSPTKKAKTKKTQQKAQKRRPRYYTVKPGDSLNKISYKFYRRYDKWPKIYRANRDKLAGPSSLTPGQRIKIP